MSEFKREKRYVVIKLKKLSQVQKQSLDVFLYGQEIPTIECVVVESDWSIYEKVWSMIEDIWRKNNEGDSSEEHF